MELEESWKKEIEKKYDLKKLDVIKEHLFFLKKKNEVFYPKEEEIFLAFHLTPLSYLKVVIVGQDPYHGEDEAHGLAFSVKEGKKLPPSLKNIFKEAYKNREFKRKNGDLSFWAMQGVFLYNPILSVGKNSPLSHKNIGWEEFSNAVFEVLSEQPGPMVFMFWGKAALQYKKIIEEKKNEKFLILTAAHPSPFSCKGFFGCDHFSKANEFLVSFGEKPIDWS